MWHHIANVCKYSLLGCYKTTKFKYGKKKEQATKANIINYFLWQVYQNNIIYLD